MIQFQRVYLSPPLSAPDLRSWLDALSGSQVNPGDPDIVDRIILLDVIPWLRYDTGKFRAYVVCDCHADPDSITPREHFAQLQRSQFQCRCGWTSAIGSVHDDEGNCANLQGDTGWHCPSCGSGPDWLKLVEVHTQ